MVLIIMCGLVIGKEVHYKNYFFNTNTNQLTITQNGQGTVGTDTPIDFGGGRSGFVSGSVQVYNQMVTADFLSYDGARISGVEGFQSEQDHFHAEHIDRMEYLDMVLVDADDVYGYDDYISFGSGGRLDTGTAELGAITGFEGNSQRVSFDSVSVIRVDNLTLVGLGNSSFLINSDGRLLSADISSAIDNNTMLIGSVFVTLDNGEGFHEEGYSYFSSMDNIVLDLSSEHITGSSRLWVENMDARCVVLAPNSRYELFCSLI